jgi:hypothetical protein
VSDLPDIPQAAKIAAAREYCLDRYSYDGPYEPGGRDAHIEADTRATAGEPWLAAILAAAREHLPPTDAQRAEIAAQALRDGEDLLGDLRAALIEVRHTANRCEDQAAELHDLADSIERHTRRDRADALGAPVAVPDVQSHQPGPTGPADVRDRNRG